MIASLFPHSNLEIKTRIPHTPFAASTKGLFLGTNYSNMGHLRQGLSEQKKSKGYDLLFFYVLQRQNEYCFFVGLFGFFLLDTSLLFV